MLWQVVFGDCCRWPTARPSKKESPTPSPPSRRIYSKTPSPIRLRVEGLGGAREASRSSRVAPCGPDSASEAGLGGFLVVRGSERDHRCNRAKTVLFTDIEGSTLRWDAGGATAKLRGPEQNSSNYGDPMATLRVGAAF